MLDPALRIIYVVLALGGGQTVHMQTEKREKTFSETFVLGIAPNDRMKMKVNNLFCFCFCLPLISKL